MGARTGLGLKAVQFCLRSVIFLCAIVVLGIYAYFLAALHSRRLPTPTWVRAVEGLSGAAALYSLLGLLLLWCLAGHALSSAAAVFLDVCFVACFIYVATANRGGAGRCRGDHLRTPFGFGADTQTTAARSDGTLASVPRFRTSCRLETACLAVSIIALLLFCCTAAVELLLVRHHRRERRFGPGPRNNYTAGSGTPGYTQNGGDRRRFGLFGKKSRHDDMSGGLGVVDDPNALPAHAEPDQMRQSYATETTAVGSSGPAELPAHSTAGGGGGGGVGGVGGGTYAYGSSQAPTAGVVNGALPSHQNPYGGSPYASPYAAAPYDSHQKYGNPPNF